jgi:hypothetical protein
MNRKHQPETETYNEKLHHLSRGVAQYYRYAADKVGLKCLPPPPSPFSLPSPSLLAHFLSKSVAI